MTSIYIGRNYAFVELSDKTRNAEIINSAKLPGYCSFDVHDGMGYSVIRIETSGVMIEDGVKAIRKAAIEAGLTATAWMSVDEYKAFQSAENRRKTKEFFQKIAH